MKIVKRLFVSVLLLAVICVSAFLWVLYGSKTSNPRNYATVGDIPTPFGYERIDGDDAAYSRYLRSFPRRIYFPTQKWEKMLLSVSVVVISPPVISARSERIRRRSSAIRSDGMLECIAFNTLVMLVCAFFSAS